MLLIRRRCKSKFELCLYGTLFSHRQAFKQHINHTKAPSAYLVAWLLCHQETAHQRSQAHNQSFVLPISASNADTHYLCSLALGTQQMTMHQNTISTAMPTMGAAILTRPNLALSWQTLRNIAAFTYHVSTLFARTCKHMHTNTMC